MMKKEKDKNNSEIPFHYQLVSSEEIDQYMEKASEIIRDNYYWEQSYNTYTLYPKAFDAFNIYAIAGREARVSLHQENLDFHFTFQILWNGVPCTTIINNHRIFYDEDLIPREKERRAILENCCRDQAFWLCVCFAVVDEMLKKQKEANS